METGALEPIATESHFVPDGGVRFLVRSVSSLARKETFRKVFDGDSQGNPFLPYEPVLHVGDPRSTHVCLLNKYNVVDHHLLIATREFEPQESWLRLDDFCALWRCMLEYESLGFYNSSPTAGASQPHKHVQLIPLPLVQGSNGSQVPMDRLFADMSHPAGDACRLGSLPFHHAFVRWAATGTADQQRDASRLWTCYQKLLTFVGWDPDLPVPLRAGHAHNLLVTRKWMLLVPRTKECFGDISLNALAFAGALLVRDGEQLEQLRQAGPFAALAAVTAR